MRQIKTFILHLYTGLELGGKTCGSLQKLPGRKTLPFKTNTELLDLLKQLANEEIKDLSMQSTNENDAILSRSNQSIK